MKRRVTIHEADHQVRVMCKETGEVLEGEWGGIVSKLYPNWNGKPITWVIMDI